MAARTLASRLFLLTAIWAVFSIVLIAWFISQAYRQNAEVNLTDRLTANLYNIMGSVSLNEQGNILGKPDLRDSRFQAFQSGYYWSVTQIANSNNVIRSASLVGTKLEIPDFKAFDASFQRQFISKDDAENELIGIEAQAFLGDGDDLFSFKITGNQSEIDKQVSDFIQKLLIMLALFALGFILVTYFIVRLGLAPLASATSRLTDIREGRASKLEGQFPREIQPFINETNSLIRSNNNVIERARTQVGNLAHSLKTPLAVLRNEGRKARPEVKKIINTQVDQMQNQIQTYLDRARIAARSGTLTSYTPVTQILERLVRVLSKLNPHLKLTLSLGSQDLVFSGEKQDLEEMVGNLLENACKFAKNEIDIIAGQDLPDKIFISVRDDGVGMSKAQCQKALQRGSRIDESKPGSGLGLSIVKDIAGEYEGSLYLSKLKQGGLEAKILLPGGKKNVTS